MVERFESRNGSKPVPTFSLERNRKLTRSDRELCLLPQFMKIRFVHPHVSFSQNEIVAYEQIWNRKAIGDQNDVQGVRASGGGGQPSGLELQVEARHVPGPVPGPVAGKLDSDKIEPRFSRVLYPRQRRASGQIKFLLFVDPFGVERLPREVLLNGVETKNDMVGIGYELLPLLDLGPVKV